MPVQSGTLMPDFTLSDPAGRAYSLTELMGPKGLLIAFTCNHCPYAVAVWPRLIALAAEYAPKGIHTVAINPNIHPAYPDDSPARMRIKQAEWRIPFPYVVDADQRVARSYQAQCTPDIYLLSPDRSLAYHGRIDDSWKDPAKVTREELRAALDARLADVPYTDSWLPSMGCSIKWVYT